MTDRDELRDMLYCWLASQDVDADASELLALIESKRWGPVTDTRKGDLIVRTKQMLSDELAAEYCRSRAPAWCEAVSRSGPELTWDYWQSIQRAEVESYMRELEPAIQEFVGALVIGRRDEADRIVFDLQVVERGWLLNERSGGSIWCRRKYYFQKAFGKGDIMAYRREVIPRVFELVFRQGLKELWDGVQGHQLVPLGPASDLVEEHQE